MLKPVDIAVVFDAAFQAKKHGAWSRKEVHEQLGLAWSSVSMSFRRLEAAGLIRGSRVNRSALSVLLPVLRYLVPAELDREHKVNGHLTAISAPVFEGKVALKEPFVWQADDGEAVGYALKPLHEQVARHAVLDEERHALMASIDAIRMGKAREYGLARQVIEELVGLPSPMVAR